MSCYQQLPIAFDRGSGAFLTAQNGEEYLDALSGIAVCGLGHAHADVSHAIADQASKLLHTSNLYQIPLQQALAERLTALSGMEKVFFANSGAEANEAAIKIARLYGRQRGIDCPSIITAMGSFHGRTMATLSATGNAKVQDNFAPLVERFIHVPYDNIEALADFQDDSVVAVMLEPIQGEGGVIVPRHGYLGDVQALCKKNNWLFMLDEIQTGMCRTGEWFAFQHERDVSPDVLTLAKSLGNGVPIGACLAQGVAAGLMQRGQHGSTFGGNPLAARAGLAVVDVLSRDALYVNAASLGAKMLDNFRDRLLGVKGVLSIRGKGLMLGIELDRACVEVVDMALEEHLLINVTANNVIRMLPPLIIDEAIADRIVSKVVDIIEAFLAR